MPSATVKSKTGAVITIEGTQAEVADILFRLELGEVRAGAPTERTISGSGVRSTPAGLLSELIDDGFFAQPRELGLVRAALQEKGHFYPVTTLSPLLLRLVRKKELRRIKESKHWTYVR